MIIFGTSSRESVRDQGSFLCPRCSMQRAYQLKSVDRYFSLYFIPLIPIGSAGTYVQCLSCGGTFAEEVLTWDPEAERQKTFDQIKRMLVMVLLAARQTSAQHVARLQNAYASLTDVVLMEEEIYKEIGVAQQANVEPIQFFKREAAGLSEEGKVIVLKAAHDMLVVSGRAGPDEEVLLRQIGKALSMPKRHIETVLSFGDGEA